METIVIPMDHKPFGLYSIKKSFQNYERLRHRLRFFEPAKFAYTHCSNIIFHGRLLFRLTCSKFELVNLLKVRCAFLPM